MKISLVLMALAGASLAVGCAADASDSADGDDVTDDEVVAANVKPGDFKLYAQPHANPNPGCDVHTHLTLSKSGAHLEEMVGGMCEIAVVPNARDYRLRAAGGECGTRIFTGGFTKSGKKHSIKITDNRARLCENVVAAAIVVEEDGNTKYSSDEPPTAAVTVEGDLFHSVGIGGENTGSSIRTSNGTFELVLDDGERNQFVDGRHARVTGKKTTLSGVETHNRPAIDVESMLVCPSSGTTLNCMPGPNVRLSSLCSADNRSFVQASCPGVNYVD